MSKSILTYILLSAVSLFSLASIAGAQIPVPVPCACAADGIPDGVRYVYHCELDCEHSCGGREDDTQCKACIKLEMVFDGIECCRPFDCEPPPGF